MAKATWQGQVIAESNEFEVVEGNVYFPSGTIKEAFFEPRPSQCLPLEGHSQLLSPRRRWQA